MSSELITYINELSEPEVALDDIKQWPYAKVLLTDVVPNMQDMSIEQLGTMLKTALYIGAHTSSIIDEFVWKLGESEETAGKFVACQPGTHEYALKPDVPGYIVQTLESKIGHKQPFTSIELSLRYKKPNLHLAAKCGNARLFQYWLGCDTYKPSFVFIAASQHPQVFATLPEATRSKVPKLCRIAHLMPHVHLDVYKQLVELKGFYAPDHIQEAAELKRVDIIKFLIEEKEVPFNLIHCRTSLEICTLLFLKFGDSKVFRSHIETELHDHYMSYDLGVIKYLQSQGVPLPNTISRTALRKDDIEFYRLIRPDNKIPASDLHHCIHYQSLKCLEYVLAKEIKIKTSDIQDAAMTGDPQILQMVLAKVSRGLGLKITLESAIVRLKNSKKDFQERLECVNMLVAKIRSFRNKMRCISCGSDKNLRFCASCKVIVFCSEKCQQEARYKHGVRCRDLTIPIMQ